MPDYAKTVWVDDETPISRTIMNKIEQGIFDAIPKDQKGAVNGVATLDSSGIIPREQAGLKVVEYLSQQEQSLNRLLRRLYRPVAILLLKLLPLIILSW